jgi:hypothetical protein
MLENNYFNLLLGVPDTDFVKLIEEVIETSSIYTKTLEQHSRNQFITQRHKATKIF